MKGVMITYSSMIGMYDIMSPLLNVRSDLKPYTTLFVLPLNHVSGLFAGYTAFFDGSDTVMVEEIDATKLSSALLKSNPTHFMMVPRVYGLIEQRIRQEINKKGKLASSIVLSLIAFCGFARKNFGLNLGKNLFKKVRDQVFGNRILVLGTGGTLCDASISYFFLSLGIDLWCDCYASTETNLPIAVTTLSDKFPSGTVGNVTRYENIMVKVQNPDNYGVGEIRVKTGLIMKGYFRDSILTAAAFDDEGYFKTGDLGYINKKGYLYVTGRMKESIQMYTGKKVAPSDVDALYSSICNEIIIASCGVPRNNETYDEIHLFVEKGDKTESELLNLKNEIMEYSARTSTLYQISDLHFIDKIPTTSVGKVKRFQLKENATARNAGG